MPEHSRRPSPSSQACCAWRSGHLSASARRNSISTTRSSMTNDRRGPNDGRDGRGRRRRRDTSLAFSMYRYDRPAAAPQWSFRLTPVGSAGQSGRSDRPRLNRVLGTIRSVVGDCRQALFFLVYRRRHPEFASDQHGRANRRPCPATDQTHQIVRCLRCSPNGNLPCRSGRIFGFRSHPGHLIITNRDRTAGLPLRRPCRRDRRTAQVGGKPTFVRATVNVKVA